MVLMAVMVVVIDLNANINFCHEFLFPDIFHSCKVHLDCMQQYITSILRPK